MGGPMNAFAGATIELKNIAYHV